MNALLVAVIPVFGIMLLGYAAARLDWFDQNANRGLSLFVFNFAIPPLLFRNLAQSNLPAHPPWGYLLSYFLVAFGLFVLAYWSTRRYSGRDHQGASICAMSACFGNSVLLGIPLALTAFGEQASVPLFLLVALQSPLLAPTITIALELGRGNPSQIVLNTLRGLFSNPVIVALLLGFTWNLLTLPLPGPVEELARLLGQAAAPCALFATGAALSQYRIVGNLAESLWLVGLKIIIQPLLVWLLASQVFQLPPLWTAVAVLIAALPTGVNAYIFAQRYRIGIATATTTIFLSTALSLLTLPLVLWLLAKSLQ